MSLLARLAASLALISTLIAFALPNVAAAPSFDALYRRSMASYYAALLASARGDADATLRHAVLFQSRWDDAAKAAPDLPLWITDTGGGSTTTAAAVAAQGRTARGQLPGDVAGAHATLERIRIILRDARERRHALNFDDALTEYHDAMERLTATAGKSNEIALTTADFVAIDGGVAKADAAWHRVREASSPSATTREWASVTASTTSDLASARAAAARRQGSELQRAADSLKRRYFELLEVLSHA